MKYLSKTLKLQEFNGLQKFKNYVSIEVTGDSRSILLHNFIKFSWKQDLI